MINSVLLVLISVLMAFSVTMWMLNVLRYHMKQRMKHIKSYELDNHYVKAEAYAILSLIMMGLFLIVFFIGGVIT